MIINDDHDSSDNYNDNCDKDDHNCGDDHDDDYLRSLMPNAHS